MFVRVEGGLDIGTRQAGKVVPGGIENLFVPRSCMYYWIMETGICIIALTFNNFLLLSLFTVLPSGVISVETNHYSEEVNSKHTPVP